MKLSKYRQKHSEIVGAVIALTELLPVVKDAMDYSLSFVADSEEIAALIDENKRVLDSLEAQRESNEKEMAAVRANIQKERDHSNKKKERAIAQAKEMDAQLQKKMAEYIEKEKAEVAAHNERMNVLGAKESELSASIVRKTREESDIEKRLNKLKASIGGIG